MARPIRPAPPLIVPPLIESVAPDPVGWRPNGAWRRPARSRAWRRWGGIIGLLSMGGFLVSLIAVQVALWADVVTTLSAELDGVADTSTSVSAPREEQE
jgi:hypothetical protein